MILKVISIVCYILAGVSVYSVSFMAFLFGLPSIINIAFWGVFCVPGLICLIIGLAIRGFQDWKRDIGIVLLSGVGATLFLLFVAILVYISPESKELFPNINFTFSINYVTGFCCILILSAIGTVLIIISKIERKPEMLSQEKKKYIRQAIVTLV
ncbi:hypothetical protein ACFL6H_08060, partial [Candidatus Latescibacterota bacterium]